MEFTDKVGKRKHIEIYRKASSGRDFLLDFSLVFEICAIQKDLEYGPVFCGIFSVVSSKSANPRPNPSSSFSYVT